MANNPTPLSPAAQSVLDAVASATEGGWIEPDFVPREAHKIAAALHAVADRGDIFCDIYEGKVLVVRVEHLLAVAAELGGCDP